MDVWHPEKGRYQIQRADFTPYILPITIYVHKAFATDKSRRAILIVHELCFKGDGESKVTNIQVPALALEQKRNRSIKKNK